MPPNEKCPNCFRIVEDWHIEWYKTEVASLFKGLVAMDCPRCGSPVGFQQGTIGPTPLGISVVKRGVEKAAEWSPLGAQYEGGTLHGYIAAPGPGSQYASYWTLQEEQQADLNEKAKKKGP